ncbi:MAG: M13 family metallopeptidase, partial [Thermoanaerobaculia bacterium]
LHSHGIMSPLFVFGSSSDLHDPNQDMAELHQGGRGLPERSYYFEQDEKSKGIRDAYVAHVAALLRLGGEDEARASRDAQSAMKIETALAQGSMSRAELRNPDAVDHPMSREELRALAPHFDWDDYFRVMGAPEFTRINVSQPEFVRAIDRQIESTDVDEWKGYLRWRVLTAVADQLPGALEAEDFAFYGKTLAGRQENYPRWRRCVDAADGALGDALGRLYVARAFPPSAKAHAQQMIDNLIAALRSDIAELQWMSPATREKAAEKLARYKIEIGYPSRWRDYGALDVADAPYVTNAMAASSFEIHRTIAKIGKLRDKTEWEMNPHEVNAYNSPTLNSITFPAGILQPPFFDPNGDDGYNYGGMGAVIGHEIIHGFDDEGRRFDALGNLHDWWQPDDSKQFDRRASCVSNQFSSYVVGDVHVNGNLVLGESIADLGGLKIAYAAYQRSLASKGRAVVDGFTPEQRFFLGWARIWATSATPESERLQTTANEHPVSRFRVNGPMSNMPEFAAAFQCAAGTSMVRADAMAAGTKRPNRNVFSSW